MFYIGFPITSAIFILILIVIYFSKKRIDLHENKLIIFTMVLNVVGCMLHLACYWASINIVDLHLLKMSILKLYIIYICAFNHFLSIYILTLTNPKYKTENFNVKEYTKKANYVLLPITFITTLLIIILPLELYAVWPKYYSYGPAVDILFVESALLIILWLVRLLNSVKKSFGKKETKIQFNQYYAILIGVVLLGSVGSVTQLINKEALLITTLHSIVLALIYFTIENPDVKMLEEVSLAKEAAERANNAKTDFLSNMSHEIRTPLNAIVGFSESLKEDNLSQESKDKVNYIITASNNLLEIVNGILDISKIEANKLEIINKEYDVRSLLDELVSLTKARIGDKELDFRVNIDQSIPSVLYGDNTRLKQIILNLLTNAVKYTKEGFVDFTVSTVIKDNVCRLIISVEDSGIGIKEENLSKLFSKFERLDVEKQITIEGTGLGLAITEKLVELMNGKIVVQSVFGKGSKFTVSIDQRIIAIEKPEQEKPAKAEAKIVNANGAKILLVDDNELNIKVASVLLKKYNFNIDSCTSGLACIAKINNGEQYDIIFMDDMMPRMSGRETLQKLKSNPDFKIPIIALTANAITGMKEEYLKCGFDDYLSKPIEKLELERVIKKYVNKLNSSSINTNLYNSPKSIIKDNLTIELPVLSNEKEQQDNLNNKKILLVDDNELNIKVAQTTLKKYNFDITSVTSGSSCIEKAIDNKYDLILLDDMMPELDGCTTLDNLKTLENFNTPVVMMTASSYDEVEEKIKKHGFDGYLAKPINKEELDKVLENLLN